MVVQAYNPSILEAEQRRFQVQDQSELRVKTAISRQTAKQTKTLKEFILSPFWRLWVQIQGAH
jgi:hypothetical protein